MISQNHPEFIQFPNPNDADDLGFIGHGADLEINTLLSAYQQGIFPWFNPNEPILWWSPNPRMILPTGEMHISRSLRKVIRSNRFQITCGTAFERVIEHCSKPRMGLVQEHHADKNMNTWITAEMKQAYIELHQAGYAQSIECWENESLVGGLYGVCIAGMYFGESMFSKVNNASKVALAALCQFLYSQKIDWIDCQVESEHLISLGAISIERATFLEKVSSGLNSPNNLDWNGFEKNVVFSNI